MNENTIEQIVDVGELPTFDIEVESDPHNYVLANGVIGHNSYSFNKSHCVAYSLIAWKTMMLKMHFPYEFYTALLCHEKDENDVVVIYRDMKRNGIKVLPPDINRSGVNFTLEKNNAGKRVGVRCGMLKVKFVGEQLCADIRRLVPFIDIEQFMCTVPRANKRAVENFIKSGFFDNVHGNRKALLENYELLRSVKQHTKMYADGVRLLKNSRKMRDRVRQWCTDGRRRTDPEPIVTVMRQVKKNWGNKDWSRWDKEQELMSVYPAFFTRHPVEYYESELSKLSVDSFLRIKDIERIQARLRKSKKYRTKQVMIILIADGDIKVSKWAEWVGHKPTKEDILENSGITKYPYGAPYVKMIVIDKDSDEAVMQIKPDKYSDFVPVMSRVKDGEAFIASVTISNMTDRLNATDIVLLEDLKAGNASGDFVDALRGSSDAL